MRRGTRAAWAALMMVLAIALALGDDGAAQAERAPVLRVAPVYHRTSFPDPSVTAFARGFVATATGPFAKRAVARTAGGPWHRYRRALVRMPRWARSSLVWAPDVVRARRGWLLYYSAVATRPNRRCIGVAVARRPLDMFRPVGRRPLVCPRRGAIDPSAYVGRRGGRYLVFKTQGLPATIRVLRLTGNGRHRARHAGAVLAVRSRHIVENPVVVRHGRELVLFTSEYYYGSCAYRTTWRRARTVAGLRRARVHSLLDQRHTRVCGPGGADVSRARHGQLVYFHGWRRSKRVLYAAHLRWRHGAPRVRGYIRRA